MSAELSLPPLDQPSQPPQAADGERQSLYRAYRSLDFAEVAGQGHVTQTLRNAVRSGTVAHAYLFTGPRGTGKTSTARILARAVNCLRPRDGEPCNECAICVSMLERRSLDLVEIDGASNNSVDDVRELRERVQFRPAEARRKVFIIDEVHMLSIGAFNALLKTLEEPPDHVLFLLATTEVHKVPATVASRCQIFALRPIPAPEVVERLRFICGREGIQSEEEVLRFITTQSTGSLRDALSLLEQIRAYCGDVLHLDEVEAALGVARVTQVAVLADAMAAGDLAGALLTVNELSDSGIDPRQLTRQLVGYWREALIGRARRQPVAEPHVAARDAVAITQVLRCLLSVESATRRSDSPRWALELAIADATLALGAGGAPSAGRAPVAEHTPRSQTAVVASTVAAPRTAVLPAGEAPLSAWPAEPAYPSPPDESMAAPVPEEMPEIGISAPAAMTRNGAEIPAEQPRAGDADAPGALLRVEEVRERWPAVMRWLQQNNKRLIHSSLQMTTSSAISVEKGVLIVGYPRAHHVMLQQLEQLKHRQVIAQAASEVLGGHWEVRYVTIEELAVPAAAELLDDDEYVTAIATELRERQRDRRQMPEVGA